MVVINGNTQMNRPNVILAALGILARGVKRSVVIDSTDQKIMLANDQESPGNSMTYGTNSSGVKGWKADVSVTIADGSITNAKLVNEAQATIKGRAAGAGTGVPQDLTPTQVKTLLAIAGTDVSNAPAGNIAATTVQAAINELDTEKQPLDSDLTAIAALSASNDDIIQRKTGAWTNRTPAQFKVDLVLSKSDVGLSSVDNTSDANKPVSTAQATAIAGKVSKTGDSMTGPLAMGANKITGGAPGTNSDDFTIRSQLDAVSSGITGKADVAQAAWANISLGSVQWSTHAGAYHPAQFRVDNFGQVHLRGVLDSSGTLSTFTLAGGLPTGLGGYINKVPMLKDNGGTVTSLYLEIQPDGSSAVTGGVTSGPQYILDGMSYWVD